MTETLITSEVDYEAEGRQTGYLRVPHSVTRSAYGWIPIPVTVLKNGAGPTALLLAGTHGDEYEGQIAIDRLAKTLRPDQITGRIICLPMLNFPAADAGLRCSPVDEGNLNRAFPGDPHGTPTQKIAHYVEEVLMPLADYSVDLHSGGASLYYPATLLRGPGASAAEDEMLLRMQAAFDMPYAWVFTEGGPTSSARTTMGAAARKGVVTVNAELGGGGAVTPDILACAERGLRRMLQVVGILPDDGTDPCETAGTRNLHIAGLVHAYDRGVFEPLVSPGDAVSPGTIVAAIHHPDDPTRAPTPVAAPHAGIILAKRALGRVERGDALFQIARDAE
jgi:predicted deacylase